MKRFLALFVLFACLSPAASQAQQMRVGWLMVKSSGSFSDLTNRSFEQGLRESGFVEGKNVILLRRSTDGDYNRLRDLARDLVRQNVDVIFAQSALLG